MELGQIMRRLRNERGLSILDIREVTGLSKSTISDIETGKSSPTAETLQKIADALGVQVKDFFQAQKRPTAMTEVDYILEELHKRPEMKMLFSATKNATKEDIERAVKIIEALKNN